MKLAIAILALTFATAAHADGFVCSPANGDGLTVQVYNHTQASQGTRTAAAMIISDASRDAGSRTIARFVGDGALVSQGADFTVDNSGAQDENDEAQSILGITFGEITAMRLQVAFNYQYPVAAGTVLPGLLSAKLVNGTVEHLDMNCTRYLKQSN